MYFRLIYFREIMDICMTDQSINEPINKGYLTILTCSSEVEYQTNARSQLPLHLNYFLPL